jgi:hypothetical protein
VRELKAHGSLPADMKLWPPKYLNNLVQQDHRRVKQRIAEMIGFKDLKKAAITIAGIELMHRIPSGRSGPSRALCLERRADCLNSARRGRKCLCLPDICTRAIDCTLHRRR